MATEMKRFTISLTSEMEEALDKVKKEFYYNKSQSEMVRDLIQIGLKHLGDTTQKG